MDAAAPKLTPAQSSGAVSSKTDNAYLEDALAGMLSHRGQALPGRAVALEPQRGGTDAAEAQIQAWLPQVYAATSVNKKPLYVFCHSWGSVLMHHVLTALAAKGSPVRVDGFITMGSPLVPSDGLIKLFDGMELPAQDFGSQATKTGQRGGLDEFLGARGIF